MRASCRSLAGLSLSIALACQATRAQQDISPTAIPALVERFCSRCHQGPDAEQGFELPPLFAGPGAVTAAGSTVDRSSIAAVLQRLRSRTMPPDDAPQPTDEERAQLAALFATLQPEPADARIPTIRRLGRRDWQRTIRDLVGVDIAASELLPEDAPAYGFDNLGDVLGVTPLWFEQWFDATNAVVDAVQQDPAKIARTFGTGPVQRDSLARFLARAFRRPPLREEIDDRLSLFRRLVAEGAGAVAARNAVLRSVLLSPAFLFRTEHGEPDAPHRLTQHELAVRLSYLLTGSMPDDTLRALADHGRLGDPAVLRAEADRLLRANGAAILAEEFAAQWLRTREVLTATADFRRYPQIWNGQLRPSLHQELVQFFAALVRDDGSILLLLDSDHAYWNETLSKHYGIGDVRGREFKKVALPDRQRGGVLSMGAALMVTSLPLRTSPVQRGKWILDQLLDAPPPPPPANAGVLPSDDQQPDGLSLRARLERHRRDRSCASCHATIDPLGFALENYDVLGQWRTEIHGKPVDATGTLPDGTSIDGVVGLKDALLARKDDFTRAMAKKLLVFAVGRPMTEADEPGIRRIVASTAAGDYRFGSLLTAMLTSPLFLCRDPGGKP